MSDATGQPATEFAALIALQDHDLHVDQLAHRRTHLPERTTLSDLEHELARDNTSRAGIEKDKGELDGQLAVLEKEATDLTSRVAAIEARLSEGGAASFRDQEAMALEIDSLAKHRAGLEDKELELMEAIEPLDVAIADLDARSQAIHTQAAHLVAALRSEEATIDAELATLNDVRSTLSQSVPEPLRAEYERLRARLGGIGAARVVRGSCSGCNLALSATEIDHIKHSSAATLFHCEQCGRILVP